MYSDEDIARLRIIKYLVDEVGLNLAGVELALRLRAKLYEMQDELEMTFISRRQRERLQQLIREMLQILGTP